jgi:ketosteroid isomerase-like protein
MERTLSRATAWIGLLIAGSLACAASAADPGRAALEAAIQRWTAAVAAQDGATLTATMTADVELMDDDATVWGRDAAVRALRDATPGRQAETTSEITIAGDVAWHVAGLAQTRANGDVHARGQALEIWKRENGEWKLHRRMTTGPGAAADLLTRPSTSEPVLDRPR